VAVFLPIFFLGGLTGRLFREFAMVVAGAIIISTFVSLSLTPMMSSRMIRKSERKGRIMMAFKQIVDFLIRNYHKSLVLFMKRKWISLPVIVITAALIYLFGSTLQRELAPLEDKSRLRLFATAPEGTSYESMDKYQVMLMKMLDTIPEKKFLLGVTAPSFGSSTSVNSSFIFLTLVPPNQREKSQMQLATELNGLVRKYTFAQCFVTQEPTIQASRGGLSGLPIQFVIQAPDLDRLKQVIPKFMAKADADSTFSVVTIDMRFNKPEYTVEINRDKALDMGISVNDIAATLQTFLSDQRIGYFIKNGKQYYVIANAEKKQRSEPLDLKRIAVRNKDGEMVTLDNLVNLVLDSRPPQLLRYNRYVSATVSASPAGGKTIGDGIDRMNQIAGEVLDESFSTSLAGSSSDYAESSGNVLMIFIFALILVYLTLAGQFESFRDPLTIMFTVPLALAGALMSLFFFGQTLNIFSEIGIIVLVGIVTKNGILIVEFANQKRRAGMQIKEAVIEAASQRFRPILMTSMATVLGVLPIALAIGEASTSRIPMGISIIGGLIFSLILTLYIIPAVYTYISSKIKKEYVEEETE
jgi:multidrug efflux pump